MLSSGCTHINECYQVTKNDDLTYNYIVMDKSGNILLSDTSLNREPRIEVISENTLGVTVQFGTGLSTRQTIFCDVDKGILSEIFTSVLNEYENKVIFLGYNNGVHSIIVQDIFDRDSFYKETVLNDAVGPEPVCSLIIQENGSAEVTYHKVDCLETEIYIELE